MKLEDVPYERLVEDLSVGLKTIFDAPVEFRVNTIQATNSIKAELIRRLAEGERAIEALKKIVLVGHNDDCLFCGFKDKIAKNIP